MVIRDKSFEDGVKFFKIKRWDMALQAFQAVESDCYSTEEKAELAYYLGLCYTKMERYSDALVYLDQVVSMEASPLRVCQCRMTLAYIYMTTRQTKLAEFELDRLIKGGFKAAQIYVMMAYSAWQQKDPARAAGFYEKALEIDAGNLTAINGLGYVLVDADIDVKRGLEYCKKAVERRPQSAAYLDSLGWAYYKNGNLAEAKNWIRRALDISPREKDIKGHMRVITGDPL